ncbi:hypothetical protein A2U01_0082675, partial [Trifolium medium]|nr:hypothetical protein [Trifolium medium]
HSSIFMHPDSPGSPSAGPILVSVGDLVRDAYLERESSPRPTSPPFQ